jgi:hypothetical protein
MSAKKTTAVRKDPAPRPINAGSPYFDLSNPSPDRKYVWVYKAAPEHGVDYYEGMGYTPVQYQAGGTKCRIGKTVKPGDFIESRGHILMEITAERAQELYEFGDDGQSGQHAADVIERRMHQTKKAVAELAQRAQQRSQHGNKYFSFEAESGSVAVIPNGDD